MSERQHVEGNLPRVEDIDLFRLIGVLGYLLHGNTLIGNAPPTISAYYRRMQSPVPGDLVLEWSTIWRWAAFAIEAKATQYPALGILLRVAQEPMPTAPEELDEGETPQMETVYYVRPLDGSVPEYRWTNASFLALPMGLKGFIPDTRAEARP